MLDMPREKIKWNCTKCSIKEEAGKEEEQKDKYNKEKRVTHTTDGAPTISVRNGPSHQLTDRGGWIG